MTPEERIAGISPRLAPEASRAAFAAAIRAAADEERAACAATVARIIEAKLHGVAADSALAEGLDQIGHDIIEALRVRP